MEIDPEEMCRDWSLTSTRTHQGAGASLDPVFGIILDRFQDDSDDDFTYGKSQILCEKRLTIVEAAILAVRSTKGWRWVEPSHLLLVRMAHQSTGRLVARQLRFRQVLTRLTLLQYPTWPGLLAWQSDKDLHEPDNPDVLDLFFKNVHPGSYRSDDIYSINETIYSSQEYIRKYSLPNWISN